MGEEEEKRILDEADEEKIFGETIRLLDETLKGKTITRGQHRQAVQEYIAILHRVIDYHKGRLRRMNYKYRG